MENPDVTPDAGLSPARRLSPLSGLSRQRTALKQLELAASSVVETLCRSPAFPSDARRGTASGNGAIMIISAAHIIRMSSLSAVCFSDGPRSAADDALHDSTAAETDAALLRQTRNSVRFGYLLKTPYPAGRGLLERTACWWK